MLKAAQQSEHKKKKESYLSESAQREPSRVLGGWELFWGGRAKRFPVTENKNKKLKIIPKKSYKILDKRKILWYNKSR